jgi:CRP-like cAMP-binding protein
VADSRLLKSLPGGFLSAFLDKAERVNLSHAEVLFEARTPERFAYFPTDCMISMVVALENGNTVEAATVGNDGFVGISSFLGMNDADLTAIVQLPGESLRIPTEEFKQILVEPEVRAVLGAYVAKTLATVSQSVACNTFHPVNERLARWLLLVRDATQRDEFALTQEFIAVMLGVHRPTVTIAMQQLEAAELIEHRRGRIRIVAPEALAESACECYRRSSWDRAKFD